MSGLPRTLLQQRPFLEEQTKMMVSRLEQDKFFANKMSSPPPSPDGFDPENLRCFPYLEFSRQARPSLFF